MSRITFQELVKKIHPDMNPDITDPGGKMAEAKRNRNNPFYLFQLAVSWGIVQGNGQNFNTKTHRTNSARAESQRRSDWTADQEGHIFRAEDQVIWKMKRKWGYGIIKKIDKVRKGHRKGFYKILLVDIEGNRVLKAVRSSLKEGPDLRTAKKEFDPSEKNRAQVIWSRSQVSGNSERYARENLGPNRSYWSQNVWAYVRTRNNWFRVTRTSSKSVFYWDHTLGKEKRCQFNSVTNIN